MSWSSSRLRVWKVVTEAAFVGVSVLMRELKKNRESREVYVDAAHAEQHVRLVSCMVKEYCSQVFLRNANDDSFAS